MYHNGRLTQIDAREAKRVLTEETPAKNVRIMISGRDQVSVTFDFKLKGYTCKGQIIDIDFDEIELDSPPDRD